jgi:antitoxin component YwqK of YwqJK toxin-antitoxin module
MKKIRKYIAGVIILCLGIYGFRGIAQSQKQVAPPTALQSQTPFLTPEEKRELRKNLVVKEWNTDAKGKRKWMDHLTVWDENGFKLEEIEYAVYGQKERVTFEYDSTGKCVRENVYNDKNKLYRIRKYEYLPNGRKKIQYNYNPDGKLYSTKMYEYAYS